ncbi:hypothetical protein TrVE_jg7474 [Triparma verrucosa]|uniref:Maintenance of mitochondrial morphology protein 1 n=1 Tax=Triparma verrucosa TaxID=1606542 RepID=A0A9W7F5V5_9STRA|nr:hypothetical protein TrVE_jg7474 [Triparma verrucosa]
MMKKWLFLLVSAAFAAAEDIDPSIEVLDSEHRAPPKHQGFGFDDDLEGARLLTSSLRLFESTARHVADALRIAGDTTAGVGGTGIKLMGGGVKSLGNAIEKSVDISLEKHTDSRVKHATKKVAGHSVKVFSTLVKGLGESFLLVGQATESVASGTAGVAEDTVRVLEELLGTFADQLGKDDMKASSNAKKAGKPKTAEAISSEEDVEDYISFSEWKKREEEVGAEQDAFKRFVRNSRIFCALLKAWIMTTIRESLRDVGEVKSIVPDIGGAFIVSVLLGVWGKRRELRRLREEARLLSDEEEAAEEEKNCAPELPSHPNHGDHQDGIPVLVARKVVVDHHDGHDHHSSTTTHLASSSPPPPPVKRPRNRARSKSRSSSRSITLRFVSLFFNSTLLTLIVQFSIFLFVVRTVTNNARTIQRNSETKGFRSAISSVAQKQTSNAAFTAIPSYESSIWANNLLESLWRVQAEVNYTTLQGGYTPKYALNEYVRRAIVEEGKKEIGLSSSRRREDSRQKIIPLFYGGLEPYLSTTISSIVASTLRAFEPESGAFLSLHSFTLGDKPPLVRGLRIDRGANNTVEAHFDLDFVNTNLAIILMLKLSTLSHALLPSTLISVSDLDARIPLKLTFQPTLDYPFAGPIDFSIEGGLPEVKFKVLPVSESSGLKGVDLNGMPLLSTWIKQGLNSVLEEFVDPGFVRFDLDRYLKWSTWISCGGRSGPTAPAPVSTNLNPGNTNNNNNSKKSKSKRKAEIGKIQPFESIAPAVEQQLALLDAEDQKKGQENGEDGEQKHINKVVGEKSLVIVSSDSSITSSGSTEDGTGIDGSQNLGSNIVLGNGGLEELSRIIEEELKKVVESSFLEVEDYEEEVQEERRKMKRNKSPRKIKNPFLVIGGALGNIWQNARERSRK